MPIAMTPVAIRAARACRRRRKEANCSTQSTSTIDKKKRSKRWIGMTHRELHGYPSVPTVTPVPHTSTISSPSQTPSSSGDVGTSPTSPAGAAPKRLGRIICALKVFGGSTDGFPATLRVGSKLKFTVSARQVTVLFEDSVLGQLPDTLAEIVTTLLPSGKLLALVHCVHLQPFRVSLNLYLAAGSNITDSSEKQAWVRLIKLLRDAARRSASSETNTAAMLRNSSSEGRKHKHPLSASTEVDTTKRLRTEWSTSAPGPSGIVAPGSLIHSGTAASGQARHSSFSLRSTTGGMLLPQSSLTTGSTPPLPSSSLSTSSPTDTPAPTLSTPNPADQSPDHYVQGLFDSLKGSGLPLVQPPAHLVLKLRSYQLQALGWMQSRERAKSQSSLLDPAAAVQLPYPWEARRDADGRTIYYNTLARTTQWHPPSAPAQSSGVEHASGLVRGGVLADEMGLGKTIELMALILSDIDESRTRLNVRHTPLSSVNLRTSSLHDTGSSTLPTAPELGREGVGVDGLPLGGTLVVCPLSVVDQWRREAERCAPGLLSVYVFHGPNRNKEAMVLRRHDLVITTYATLASEMTGGRRSKAAVKPRLGTDSVLMGLLNIHWWRVVLDEAHHIRDRNTRSARAACALHADRRWAVTGTPVHNRIDDVHALLSFLRAGPFAEYAYWSSTIARPARSGDQRALARLHALFAAIALRRTKLGLQEQAFQPPANGAPASAVAVSDAGVDASSTAAASPVPLPSPAPPLLTGALNIPSKTVDIMPVQLTGSQARLYALLLAYSRNEFASMVREGTVMTRYAHVLELVLRMRQAAVHPALVLRREVVTSKSKESAYRVDATPAIPSAAPAPAAEQASECGVCGEPFEPAQPGTEPPVLAACGDGFCRVCFDSVVAASAADGNPWACPCVVCGALLQPQPPATPAPIPPTASPSPGPERAAISPFVEGLLQKMLDSTTVVQQSTKRSLRESTSDLLQSSRGLPLAPLPDSDRVLLHQHEFCQLGSAKIDKVLELYSLAENAGLKWVLFSQWTSMLDLVQDALSRARIPLARLDGTMSRKSRDTSLVRFKEDDSCRVLLVSLRAGGTGLTLTAACRVVLIDPWWNPAAEAQAIDRVHRIGQTRAVKVYRLIASGTIEEKMMTLHVRKRALATGVLSVATRDGTGALSSNGSKLAGMRLDELRLLFS